MEKEEEDYKRDLEEYEQSLKEYESEVERQKREEEESTNAMFSMAFNQKQAKDGKKKIKAMREIKKPVSKLYARFLKTKKVAPKKKAEVKDIDIADLPEAKNFTEVDETRAPASLIFIGHVDAGKSTICGQIML